MNPTSPSQLLNGHHLCATPSIPGPNIDTTLLLDPVSFHRSHTTQITRVSPPDPSPVTANEYISRNEWWSYNDSHRGNFLTWRLCVSVIGVFLCVLFMCMCFIHSSTQPSFMDGGWNWDNRLLTRIMTRSSTDWSWWCYNLWWLVVWCVFSLTSRFWCLTVRINSRI